MDIYLLVPGPKIISVLYEALALPRVARHLQVVFREQSHTVTVVFLVKFYHIWSIAINLDRLKTYQKRKVAFRIALAPFQASSI